MRNDLELARARALLGAGRPGEAIAMLERAIAADPREPTAPHMLGVALAQTGDLARAEKALESARKLAPKSAAVLTDLATVLIMALRPAEALPPLERARKLDPSLNSALFYQGVALTNLDRPAEALAAFDALAAREPGNPVALQNRSALLLKLGRLDEAASAVAALLARAPEHPPALALQASILIEQSRHEEALTLCERILARDPLFAEAHAARGAALARLERTDDAVAAFQKALDLRPDYPEALLNLARTEGARGRLAESLAALDRLLAIAPSRVDALFERALCLQRLARFEDAIATYDRLLALAPDHRDAAFNRASAMMMMARYDEAATAFERLFRRAPDHDYLLGLLIHARMQTCDWRDIDKWTERLRVAIDEGKRASPPFPLLALDIGQQRLRAATSAYAALEFPSRPLFPPRRAGGGDKIRVAYLSGEFRDQATAYLMAEVYENHDRARFDIVGIDTGAADDGAMRARIGAALGGLKTMADAPDREIARFLADGAFDIAINLNGWFGQGRNGVFAARPCPVQINYLGYPGTLGADYFDYIVGDAHVIPPGDEKHFVEKIVRLPECYQPNDSRRAIAADAPSRRELGLPETGFVFCCFNNNHKIAAPMFDIWARLLKQVENSVLWLVIRNEAARGRLREEARRRGVDPARLVFAPYARLDEHLARHARADLFLDTLPHNAHTTASDSLWAGVPVLTCAGDTFAGRVAASLLDTVGLPELATRSLDEYEALALRLARDPALLDDLRARLARVRRDSPLFDGRRYTRHLERAFETMVEKSRRGEAPAGFDVEALPR